MPSVKDFLELFKGSVDNVGCYPGASGGYLEIQSFI